MSEFSVFKNKALRAYGAKVCQRYYSGDEAILRGTCNSPFPAHWQVALFFSEYPDEPGRGHMLSTMFVYKDGDKVQLTRLPSPDLHNDYFFVENDVDPSYEPIKLEHYEMVTRLTNKLEKQVTEFYVDAGKQATTNSSRLPKVRRSRKAD